MNCKRALIVLFISILCIVSLFSAEQSERFDTPELRIENLASDIERHELLLARLQESDDHDEVMIAELEKKIVMLKEHKALFEQYDAEWLRLKEENNKQPKTNNLEELALQMQLDSEREANWFKKVAALCDAHNEILAIQGQENAGIPFFLRGITFLGTTNLLQLDALSKINFRCTPISLSTITGRKSDATSSIFQLRVANQSGQNGGSASCGYQALKNSIIISQSILCNEDDQVKIVSCLQGVQLMRLLFGHISSPWRSKVIIERKKYIIKNFIRNRLLLALACGNKNIVGRPSLHIDAANPTQKPREHEFCVSVNCFPQGQWMFFDPYNESWMERGYESEKLFGYLSLVADSLNIIGRLVDSLYIQAVQTAPIEISSEQLIQIIIDKITSKENPLLKQSARDASIGKHQPYEIDCTTLKNVELIKQYFTNIEKIRILINSGIQDLSTSIGFNQDAYQEYLSSGRFGNGNGGLAGEWVAQEEIKGILQNEISMGLLQIPSSLGARIVPFFAGDGNNSFTGTLRFEMPAYINENGEEVPAQFQYDYDFIKIRTLLADKTSHVVIPVILRLPGHWITMVINKVGKNKQYIIADSENSPRINSESIREMIALLEGLQEPVAAPSEEPDVSNTHDSTPKPGGKRPRALRKDSSENNGSWCTIS